MTLNLDGKETLGEAMFGSAELGNRRRTARLVTTFDLLRRHPGSTLPNKMASPPDLKALYRLMERPEVTHEALMTPLRAYTSRNIAACQGAVLLIHDATELDFTDRHSLAEHLGQIGSGQGRGYISHHVLAVDPQTHAVLGLMEQILHCRDEVPKNETLPEHRARLTRESRLWIKGTKHLPRDRRLVDVADQGADTFEFLEHECHSGRTFVIRACKNRVVQADHAGKGPKQYLRNYAHGLPELGRFMMGVQSQRNRNGSFRTARVEAEFVVRGGTVLVHPPHAKAGEHGDDPLPLYVVLVMEVHPPAGEKPIEWMLLTNEPVSQFKDAWRVTSWYECRWVVEEYHKGMKTGCGVEDLQFTAVERLQPAIALLSAVALTLLDLRDASRREDAKTRPVTTVVTHDYVAALTAWRYGEVRMKISVHEFYYALARLGGHQNRTHDKRPGWLVLWRGWTKLQAMLDGYLAAQRQRCG
ncbi:MAG: IS4 family transposase [bacterium]